jgi:hypothetical protein
MLEIYSAYFYKKNYLQAIYGAVSLCNQLSAQLASKCLYILALTSLTQYLLDTHALEDRSSTLHCDAALGDASTRALFAHHLHIVCDFCIVLCRVLVVNFQHKIHYD